ncbi:MAG: ATP-dependent nuclease subunit B-like protein [Candidatus Solibacter sp.]|nr:ATP-dependent nuclease subunit B-like protein [Candidatus Solibacter sp.]
MLSGPAGSGKTTYIMDRLREALRSGSHAVRLLVPTATMAQHLQNRLAREGFVFSHTLIQTLSGFLKLWTGDAPEVSQAVLYLLVDQAARKVARPEFERVTQFHGFCSSLARTIEEFASAGCDSARLAANLPDVPLGDAFLAVYQEVDRELARRGLALRGTRLANAAARIDTEGLPGIHTIWLDGFHALPDPELAVIAALGKHTELTLTLDEAELGEGTLARLGALDFSEEQARGSRTRPALALVKAPSIEREVEEIAHRILLQAESGRPFREIGVIVRSPEIYAPILHATLDRFGIPARVYFDERLERHPVVRFLSGAVDAMLGGWDHAATLAVLRLAPRFADFGVMDRFDFDVRERTPQSGLGELRSLLMGDDGQPRPYAEGLLHKLDSLSMLEEWRGFELAPKDWAARFATLRAIFRPSRPTEPITHEIALQYRSQAAVLDVFDEALDEAAQALSGARHLPIEDFWRAVKSILRLKPLRLADGRRNVVNVMSAHEARQWVLPVVFVCGMVEKQFPRIHHQDPFFNDPARCRLNAAGIRVRTAAEFEREERLLFDAAITRATMLATLSYPEFDARGERNLQSIYLEGLILDPQDAQPVRPSPRRQPSELPAAGISRPELLAYVREKTARLSPTALETFLQCPFQYFTQRFLRLKTAPDRPEQRLDFLTQGNIVHSVLAVWWQQPQDIVPLFERIFADYLKEKHIPSGYHTERLRNGMLDDLRRFTAEDSWPRVACQSQIEVPFELPLGEGVKINGRIDRLDTAPGGESYVIDYKYSAPQRVKDKVKDESLLQAPLYMMAAEHLGLRPAGMYYLGVKGEIIYAGWSDLPLMESLGMPENWLENTRRRTLEIVARIRSGTVDVHPADRENCRFCDAKDICRVETQSPALVEIAEGV